MRAREVTDRRGDKVFSFRVFLHVWLWGDGLEDIGVKKLMCGVIVLSLRPAIVVIGCKDCRRKKHRLSFLLFLLLSVLLKRKWSNRW